MSDRIASLDEPGVFCYLLSMRPTLPLSEMTLAEKLETMESLWEDICRDSDAFESPE